MSQTSAANQAQAVAPSAPFRTISDCIREHALREPGHLAICDEATQIDYGKLDALMDRVASAPAMALPRNASPGKD